MPQVAVHAGTSNQASHGQACFLNVWHFVKSHIFKEFLGTKVPKLRPKVRFVINFLTSVRFVVHVYFWSQITNFAFYMAHIYPPGGARWLPWLHIETLAFLHYQHILIFLLLMLIIFIYQVITSRITFTYMYGKMLYCMSKDVSASDH